MKQSKKAKVRLEKRIAGYEESMKRLKTTSGYKKPGSNKK